MPRPGTTPPVISQKGERLDLEIVSGATLGPIRHYLENPPVDENSDPTPFDFTGCVVRGTVRASAVASGEPLAEIEVTWPLDRTLGYYDFGLNSAVVELMPAPEPVNDYWWNIELVDSLDRVLPLFYGKFRLLATAARPDTEEDDTSSCCQ